VNLAVMMKTITTDSAGDDSQVHHSMHTLCLLLSEITRKPCRACGWKCRVLVPALEEDGNVTRCACEFAYIIATPGKGARRASYYGFAGTSTE
jgi:hypothetical protein